MRTINEVICELESWRDQLGRDTEVVLSFSGSTESGELLQVTKIVSGGHFVVPDGPDGEIYDLDDYIPEEGDKVKKIVKIVSILEKYVENLTI